MPEKDRYYSIKEMQTKLKLSYEPTYRHLSELHKKGYIIVLKHKNTLYYKLNLKNPEAVSLIKILEKKDGNGGWLLT